MRLGSDGHVREGTEANDIWGPSNNELIMGAKASAGSLGARPAAALVVVIAAVPAAQEETRPATTRVVATPVGWTSTATALLRARCSCLAAVALGLDKKASVLEYECGGAAME